ncbi:leucine--tRNA ligase [Fulvivirga sedimenti]|uniref:Leucine--tRNA ligase n=1 Tax=Fulvivirga sedimenti TaxID=2879465 RepID=A0A9X1HQA7_9BACT|nr:leucine--tRNA ligase [Fulvivirga sedimenti]MCA6075182.1 leucine--tRNA ligase [Fulvivirga sedimenti]MCA6076359.1 leucine--tRNA ligase [Fulvivirga sedimenti]MCA6077487.1 leucine--tRNA ligase [Fulvivirga sedimenti]
MAIYQFKETEAKWRKYWADNEIYKTSNTSKKPKFYALDMFPYPSGAGLHVGHPLGYIASDIVSRFKRLKGYNVLHPMGFDSFGLPAEQYAIQTGQHPAVTTANNIERYKEQLQQLGFSFDWSREVQTSDPSFYKWTQWIFMQLFNSWYDNDLDKARPINDLLDHFSVHGNSGINAVCDEDTPEFTAAEWKAFSGNEQGKMLLKYRLAYLADMVVNWCPALGTVLSNDEVKDGFSERGGHPVERKKMMQWMMRITAYAERLLNGLDVVDWPEPLKEMQRNWIGRSEGAELDFNLKGHDEKIRVFTTRIDTIYGVTFLVLAPESDLVEQITTVEQKEIVASYVEQAKNRSERERMMDVKTVTGVFTGAYAIHPFSGEEIPVWIADYVLAGYGTGAVMAVPAGDQRDYDFAKHFSLPIIPINDSADISEAADATKEGTVINSGFLNGLSPLEAMKKGIEEVEKRGIGVGKINFRMRDAIFTRQRYWGEPLPVYFKDGLPYLLGEDQLPLVLPEVDKYLPTEEGEPPLARAASWETSEGFPYEQSTMPGWAGSSWYFFRYMDAHNNDRFVGKEAQEYWDSVDLYIGGSEHATGHLLYSRFWTKFLFDMGLVTVDEPFKKLINQGMIQGRSNLVYRIKESDTFVTYQRRHEYDTIPMHVDVNIVHNDELDMEAFKKWRPELANAEFIPENDKFMCGHEVEKMSKSKYNVVNPDDIIERYGADTLRMYEMFLGPLEQSKPWNTNGIDGVFKFLRKLWNLFHDDADQFVVSDAQPTEAEQKIIHRTIKKAQEDIERYSFNTSVSEFMICVNELTSLKCNKREVLEKLVIILAPYAPHIAEELWHRLGHTTTVNDAEYPAYDEKFLKEDSYEYPVSVNGKMRAKMLFPVDMPTDQIQAEVLASEAIQKWLEGKSPRKVIIVPNKIVNVVV